MTSNELYNYYPLHFLGYLSFVVCRIVKLKQYKLVKNHLILFYFFLITSLMMAMNMVH